MLKLFNSLTNKLEIFTPIEPNKVKMYVCGPTVYDNAHLGHARCYITWDVLYRYLKFLGYETTYCRNVTDVDDKILKKADEAKVSPDEIASKYYKSFDDSMRALNCSKPDIEPYATKTIGEMIAMAKTLIQKDYAYAVDGDVYFDVKKYKSYGQLSKQPIDDLMAGARVETGDKKNSPLDFALWKKDENHGYNSPWGKGRPGWHIECSAMCKKHLGTSIDIHAGGADLTFPHHENEIAQSECANDTKFVNYWLHNGFVTVDKEKMSKSLGNFLTIDDLLKNFDNNTIRFFILTNHYRMPVEFSQTALEGAKNGIKKLINAGKMGTGLVDEAVEKFKEAMDEDLNTSKAMAVLFSLISGQMSEAEANTVYVLGSVLGFDFTKKEIVLSDNDLKLIEERNIARQEKNWAKSDEIRNIFIQKGIMLKDNKDGTTTWSAL